MGGTEALKKKIDPMFREMVLNIWATFIYFFSQWLLTIIITRLSGYDSAGTLTLAISFSNIFGYIGKFGMRSLQVGDVSYQYSDAQYITSRVLTSVASIAPFGVALAACNYRADLQAACIAMMCYKMLEGFDDVMIGSMQRRHRYEWIAVSYTFKAVLTLAAFTMMVLSGATVAVSIWAMTLAYLAVLVLFDLVHLAREVSIRWSASGLKSLYLQCIPLVIMTILDAVMIYLPRNAIEKLLGAKELGYYGTVSIVVVVLSTLAGAAWGSVISRYSEIIHNRRWDDFSKFTASITGVLAIVAVFAIAVGRLIGPFFFRILFGEEILSHMNLLLPVLVNAVLLMANSFFTCILVPLRQRNVLMGTDIAAVIVCAIIVNPFTVYFGTVGASGSLTLALLVRFILLVCCTAFCVRKAKGGEITNS